VVVELAVRGSADPGQRLPCHQPPVGNHSGLNNLFCPAQMWSAQEMSGRGSWFLSRSSSPCGANKALRQVGRPDVLEAIVNPCVLLPKASTEIRLAGRSSSTRGFSSPTAAHRADPVFEERSQRTKIRLMWNGARVGVETLGVADSQARLFEGGGGEGRIACRRRSKSEF